MITLIETLMTTLMMKSVILAENTRKALAEVSAAYFGHPAKQLKSIALTGTKGKTTTAHMIKNMPSPAICSCLWKNFVLYYKKQEVIS